MKKYQNFLSEYFPVLVIKLSIYLNKHVFVMSQFKAKFGKVFKYLNFQGKYGILKFQLP